MKLQNINYGIWPINLENKYSKKISQQFSNFNFVDFNKIKKNDYVFVFGGDGTFLNFLQLFYDKEINVILVNTGKVGFISSIDEKQLFEINSIIDDFDHMFYLSIKLDNKNYIAINDVKICLNKLTNSSILINESNFINSLSSEMILINYIGSTGLARSYRYPIILRDQAQYLFDILDSPQYKYNPNLNQPILISQNKQLKIEFENKQDLDIKLDNNKKSLLSIKTINIEQKKSLIKILHFNDFNRFIKKINDLY